MKRSAVFLDRDGTIIRDTKYVSGSEHVELIAGAAAALARLNHAAIPVVVVTNQSGIARGYYTEADYDRVRLRMAALLGKEGARVDATYHCPHHPDFTGPCECRKPGTLLFRRAAEELDLDLAASWFIGDTLRDVSPARALGGTGILVPSTGTPAGEIEAARTEHSVESSLDAAIARAIESRK